ncbi:MAG: hypothetical protein DIU67_008245 [Actinomycetes bacterium]
MKRRHIALHDGVDADFHRFFHEVEPKVRAALCSASGPEVGGEPLSRAGGG